MQAVRLSVVLVPLLFGFAAQATAQEPAHHEHALGKVDFPVSCSQAAQVQFNHAVALLHHMTYPRARQAFEQTATTDPRCAMAHWGIAMTLFYPMWPNRPTRAELQRGWEVAQKAESLRPPTERERLFVAAAAAFFQDPDSTDYWLRIRRWEQAMGKVHAAFPQDPEAAAFFALAQLAILPSNQVSPTLSARAAELLLSVYQRNPDHPGAMHYLVHANDVPGREREWLDVTRKYEAVAPENPHALHMPTHIYTRLGEWDAVISGNRKAAEAALKYPAGDRGQFVWDQFPHAIEYLVYAHLQTGADDKALAELNRLESTPRLQPTFITAFHLASTRARYALERRAWNEAAQLRPRDPATIEWDRFPWPEAVTWFGRGLGAARTGAAGPAREAVERLTALEVAAGRTGEDLFARSVRVLHLAVAAWLAQLNRNADSAVQLMEQASNLEISTPKHAVTPGPTLPATELLGDLLMEQGRPAEALAAYRRSVELYPGRFNGLLGVARAARASGNEALAREYYQRLLELAPQSTRRSALDEARSALR
jgi:tetratricopeptide (TPR) repeat protein